MRGRIPCSLSFPILVICQCKDAKGKVLDVSATRSLVVNGIRGSDLLLHFLQQVKEREEECT